MEGGSMSDPDFTRPVVEESSTPPRIELTEPVTGTVIVSDSDGYDYVQFMVPSGQQFRIRVGRI